MSFKGKALGYCQYCGRVGQTHRHHITYRSRGGTHDVDNRIDLCVECHGAVHSGLISIQMLYEVLEKDIERTERLNALFSPRPCKRVVRGVIEGVKVDV